MVSSGNCVCGFGVCVWVYEQRQHWGIAGTTLVALVRVWCRKVLLRGTGVTGTGIDYAVKGGGGV